MGNRKGIVVAVWLLAAPLCFCKEAVYFRTGFSLEVDSHTQEANNLVLHTGTGTLECPATDVLRIESLPDAPLAVPAAAPLTAAAPIPPAPKPEALLGQAAYVQGLDEDFIDSVAKVESGYRVNAVSAKGAIGLMQLMPFTAAQLGVDASRPDANALGGAKYLRELLIRYNSNSALALAAYNAGPGAVAKYGGIPPYNETQRYVADVLREYNRRIRAKAKPHPAPSAETDRHNGAE